MSVFPLSDWLEPVFGEPEEAEHVIAPLTIGIARHRGHARSASSLAWLFVGRREVPVTAPVRVSPVTRAARNALYADTVNESLFMRPGQWLTRALVFVDNRGVDGAVNGLAADARRLVVAAGPHADRLRAHLRPRHARRRRAGRGCAAGGDGGMSRSLR